LLRNIRSSSPTGRDFPAGFLMSFGNHDVSFLHCQTVKYTIPDNSGAFFMVANKKSGAQVVKQKRGMAERKATAKPHPAADAETAVTIDRRESRDRRGTPDRRVQTVPVAVEQRVLQRRVKVNRRRQIDPTTCERDYSVEEIEFMSAMDEYKRRNGRMFPTCSEVLEVVKTLGYERRPKSEGLALPLGEMTAAATSAPMPV
jgi:hypothetical protein